MPVDRVYQIVNKNPNKSELLIHKLWITAKPSKTKSLPLEYSANLLATMKMNNLEGLASLKFSKSEAIWQGERFGNHIRVTVLWQA